jgi:hypothetical protein
MSDPKDKKGYSTRWQEHPGYKTVVDMKSEKGILPEQTENGDLSKGQGNLDAVWPVQLSQTREKERALPLPSNHDKLRDKRIGPTYVNKPRKSPDRTLPEPGAEYGHPTKYDYNFPTRRQDVTSGDEDVVTGPNDLEAAIDNLLEMSAVINPFDNRQQNQGGDAKRYSEQYYTQHPSIRQDAKLKWRTEGKRDRAEKRQRSFRERNQEKFKRRGLGYQEPKQRTKDWREKQQGKPDVINERRDTEAEQEKKDRAKRNQREAGWEALAEAFEMLGLELTGANWPLDWNSTVKKTAPPGDLQQNFDSENALDTGTPRKDPQKQKGKSLRAPGLFEDHQKGLFTQNEPPAAGAINIPTTNNPTDGSGKVIPMEWYSDAVNNTQAIPDGRSDRYERNNNFEVKQAHFGVGVRSSFGVRKVALTLGEILHHVDDKIKERAKDRVPTLLRTDTKNWIWHWKSGNHTVKVQALQRGRAKNFPKLNLRISCSCPFWRWWGPEHWATQEGYQKGPLQGTAAYPEIRDPEHWRPICKHAYAVLEKSQHFFVRPKKHPLKKLGARFLVDSLDEIEVVPMPAVNIARVAQLHLEREISRRVAARYLAKEDT